MTMRLSTTACVAAIMVGFAGAAGQSPATAQSLGHMPAREPAYTPENVGKDKVPVPFEDRAFDPGTQQVAPQDLGQVAPPLRWIGRVPITAVPGSVVPIVTLDVPSLRPVAGGRWELALQLANNSPREIDVRIQCSFRNGYRRVADVVVLMPGVRAGEQVATEVSGPPVTSFVDNVPCEVLSPLR